jgi:hypothetical protein
MYNNRGKDFRGLAKRGDIQAIFRQQSSNWERLLRVHVNQCFSATRDFVSMAVMNIAGINTGQILMESYVASALNEKYALL